ncbi:hypothetical protein WIX39_014090 [Variovorax sp. AB1(2024)]|jgi:hypothetical protein|uniref:hypothetical protein n=1 Tax=Variovorax sp. AB1(2024) TaxID=3132214 RepID=UPI0030B3FA93
MQQTPSSSSCNAWLENAIRRSEGIGRPRAQPGFIRTLADRMVKVPSLAPVAWVLSASGDMAPAQRHVDAPAAA